MVRLIVVFTLLLGLTFKANAEHEAGFVIGSASGFSGLLDLGGNRGADLGLAWNSNSSLYVYGDYLFTNARSFNLKGAAQPMTLYYGLGARLITIKGGKNDGKNAFGPRAPIGLHYKIINPDISLFGELAAVLDLTPESNVDITAGVGVRIRF